MPDRPVPADAPEGLRLRPLGGDGWLMDRRYYLADGGAVWCREAGYAGFATPRWSVVPPKGLGHVLLHGRTLADLVAELTYCPGEGPTARGGKRR